MDKYTLRRCTNCNMDISEYDLPADLCVVCEETEAEIAAG